MSCSPLSSRVAGETEVSRKRNLETISPFCNCFIVDECLIARQGNLTGQIGFLFWNIWLDFEIFFTLFSYFFGHCFFCFSCTKSVATKTSTKIKGTTLAHWRRSLVGSAQLGCMGKSSLDGKFERADFTPILLEFGGRIWEQRTCTALGHFRDASVCDRRILSTPKSANRTSEYSHLLRIQIGPLHAPTNRSPQTISGLHGV